MSQPQVRPNEVSTGAAGAASISAGPSGDPFSASAREQIEKLIQRYPQKRSVLIPGLWIIQGEIGWLPIEAMEELAEMLEVEPVEVQETATFYTLLFKKPVGKYVVDVCTNIACMLNGGVAVSQAVQQKLGIKPGETTPDGMFTLREVECLAACMGAPAAQINYEYHENLTGESLLKTLDTLAADSRAEGVGH